MLHEFVTTNLVARFHSLEAFVGTLDESKLERKLGVSKDKSIGEHVWCLVGARESYSKALVVGEWQGFSCSIKNLSKNECKKKLKESSLSVSSTIAVVQDWDESRLKLLLDLYEHEVMHEGQMIRHMYGHGDEWSQSLKWA